MRWWPTLFVLSLSALSWGQAGTTVVTATVQDNNGNLYVNCQWSTTFIGQNTTPGAGPYAPAAYTNGQQGHCDSSGNLSINLGDNINTMTPTPSQWQFNICSAAGYPAGPYCFQVLLTITGATQNITGNLKSVAPILPPAVGSPSPGGVVGSTQVRSSNTSLAGLQPINASQLPGTGNGDIGDRINQAVSLLPQVSCNTPTSPCGGTVHFAPNPAGGCWNYSTTINIPTNVPVILEGDGVASCLNYTPSTGNAITVNWNGNHFPATLQNFMMTGPGQTTTAVGISVGSSTTFTDQVVIRAINIGAKNDPAHGFGTAILTSNSAFDLTIDSSAILNNGIGVNINTNTIPTRILNSNLTGNSTAGVTIVGGSLVLVGDDIEIGNVGACGVKFTGNAFVWGYGNHFEDPPGSAVFQYQYVCNTTAANAVASFFGGEMITDSATGTLNEFITWKGDSLTLSGVSVSSQGAIITNIVNSSSTSSTITCNGVRNGQPTVIGACVGGTTPSLYDYEYQGSGLGSFISMNNLGFDNGFHGQCTLGTSCSAVGLSRNFTNAPRCYFQWTGGGTLTGFLKVSSTIGPPTSFTLTSSVGGDTAVVNWDCFGH